MTLLRQISDGIEEAIACVERADHGINYVSGGDTERSLCVIREPLGHAHDALNELRILVNDAAEREEEEACKD